MQADRLSTEDRIRDTVLALHSSGSTGRQWERYSAAMAPGMELIAPDLLGYGAGVKSWPNGTPVSLNDEASHVAPLLDARPQGVHLLGHSYGASVALQVALRWPSRVKSLTLFEPVRFAMLFNQPGTADAAEDIVRVGRRIGFAALSGRTEAAAEIFVDYWSGDGTWQAMDEWRRQALALRMHKIRAEFEALFADRVPQVAYGKLTMPVRLITGSRSPLPARQVTELLQAVLPHARTVRIDAGHMAPITDAAMVIGALPEWLRPQAEHRPTPQRTAVPA